MILQDMIMKGLKGESAHLSSLHFVTTVCILITFLVFWTMLAPSSFQMGNYNLWSFSNLAVHGITPLLCLADYMLFNRPRKLDKKVFVFSTTFPVSYLIFALVMGFSGYVFYTDANGIAHRFPYFFIDFDAQGWWIIAYIILVLGFFLGVAGLLYLYDYFRLKRYSKKIEKQKEFLRKENEHKEFE